MTPRHSLILLFLIAAAVVVLPRNVADVYAIRGAGDVMERSPLDRFAVDCAHPGGRTIAVAASKLLHGCASAALQDLQGINDPVAAALIGDAEWQLKDIPRARAAWSAAGDYHRLLGAGDYLERTRNFDAAESMFSAADRIASKDATGGLALAALRWNRGNRTGAVQTYEAMFARDERRGGDIAYANLITLYDEQKQYREADRVVARGLALWPASVPLRTAAGVLYARSGRTALAASTLGSVWAEHPDAEDACYWLGWTHERQGDDRAAVRQFSACVARHPKDAGAWYALGAAEVRLGDIAAARAAFLSVPQTDPLHRAANDRLRELERPVH